MALMSRLSWLGFAFEAVLGTAAAPTLYIPVMNFKPRDIPQYTRDEALAGNPSKLRGEYQGEIDSAVDFECWLYPEVVGPLFAAYGLLDNAVGAAPTVHTLKVNAQSTTTTAALTSIATSVPVASFSGFPAAGQYYIQIDAEVMLVTAGAGSNTWTVTRGQLGTTVAAHLINAVVRTYPNSQPRPITLTDFDVFESRAYPGQLIDEINLKIDAKGAIKAIVKTKGFPSAPTTTPAPSFPPSAAFLGWETTASVGGSAVNRLTLFDFTCKRAAGPIHTLMGIQGPYTTWGGAVDAVAKIKSLFESNVELNHSLLNDQPAVTVTVTAPSAGPIFTLSMQKTAWKNPAIDRSGEYILLDSEIDPISNATDGATFSATLSNQVALPY